MGIEIASSVVNAIGSEKVGMRLSPYGVLNGLTVFEGVDQFYGELSKKLSELNLLYIHIVDHSSMGAPQVSNEVKRLIRQNFKGTYILSGGYDLARVEKDLLENKGKVRGKQHPALNLCNRMLRLKKEILHFMYDFDIPFTNNEAERDLRMAKVHQKISGCFRSERGARSYALFRSYILTLKKQGLGIFEGIKNLFNPKRNASLDLIFKAQ